MTRAEEPEPPGWSTEFWVTRWREGDPDASARLYVRFAPLLRLAIVNGAPWSVLRRDHDVDDVLHAFWSVVLERRASGYLYRGPHTFAAWLEKALGGFELDLVRRTRRMKRGSGRVELVGARAVIAGSIPICAPTPEPTPRSSARFEELLERARRTLKNDEYTALVLTKLQGHTSDEAGLALRRTGAAIRALVDRAVRKLLEEFDRDVSW